MYDIYSFPKHKPEKIEFIVSGMEKKDAVQYFKKYGCISNKFKILRQRFPCLGNNISSIGITASHVYLLVPHHPSSLYFHPIIFKSFHKNIE